MKFTRKGFHRLLGPDGVQISQHTDLNEAYERAYLDAQARNSAVYKYRVIPAEIELEVSTLSRTVFDPDVTPPATVSGAQATALGPTTIRVTWLATTDTGGSGLAGYRVFRSTTSGGTFAQIGNDLSVASLSFDDTSLSPGQQRFYQVRAFDGNANTSAPSSTVNATTTGSQQPPVWLTVPNFPSTAGAFTQNVGQYCSDPNSDALTFSISPSSPSTTADITAAGLTLSSSGILSGTYTGAPLSIIVRATESTAESDWQSRISGSGVVWFHDFRNATEVSAFRWSGGVGSGNDPNGVGTNAGWTRHLSTDGISGTAGGCLEQFRAAGSGEGQSWWRPTSPLSAPGNGKSANDPAAAGTLTVRSYNPTQGSGAINGHTQGYYGHQSYHSGGNFDGTEFYFQCRVKMDPRRISAGIDVGKLFFFTTCFRSLTTQEIVTYSGAVGGGENHFRMYGGAGVSLPLDQEVSPYAGIQPGSSLGVCNPANGGATCWTYSGGWDTLLYHVVMGRQGVDESRMEVFAAYPGETSYTRIWNQTFAFAGFDWNNGFNAIICSSYNNNLSSATDFYHRYTQLIFSKQFIPCPQV